MKHAPVARPNLRLADQLLRVCSLRLIPSRVFKFAQSLELFQTNLEAFLEKALLVIVVVLSLMLLLLLIKV